MGRGGYFSSAHSPTGPRKVSKAAGVHQSAGNSFLNAQTSPFAQHSALTGVNVFPPSETMAFSQFPVVYNDGQQVRIPNLTTESSII